MSSGLAQTGTALTAAVESLEPAINPFALSLNENPFPPLPSVRSALAASLDTVNRYPEFLPERLRTLIASRVGVARRPGGDRCRCHRCRRAGAACRHQPRRRHRDVLAHLRRVPDLRADGPAEVGDRRRWTATATTTWTPWPRRRSGRASSCCADRTIRPAPSSPPPMSSGSCAGCPQTSSCCSMRPTSSSSHRSTGSMRRHW